ncbi:MAG: lipase family protein [Flavobacteriales bacterium]|nr:lipase family protein [Flavobacteriales bacterium]
MRFPGWIGPLLSLSLLPAFVRAEVDGPLQAGFETAEFLETLRISTAQADSAWWPELIPPPQQYRRLHRSAVVGLLNRWDLYADSSGRVCVNLRGSTPELMSWVENFHAAMVPAKGMVNLSASQQVRYDLSDDTLAYVHVGWVIGFCSMVQDIDARLDSCFREGIRDVLVTGHSQGGALAYLVTAHLNRKRASGALPADLRIKTYCSAAPKPGNLYFAYDFEKATFGGWAYNVVNTKDWVPESPFSIQTAADFNALNPFTRARKAIRTLPFPQDVALAHVYGRMDRPTRKAERRFRKNLGNLLARFARRELPELETPEFVESSAYVRVGNTVPMEPDAAYLDRFQEDGRNMFVHHMFPPYYHLALLLRDPPCH